jgi:protein tyrosine/serine phosphatase
MKHFAYYKKMNYEGYDSDESDCEFGRDNFHPFSYKQHVISEILTNKLYLTDMFAANDKSLLINRNIKGIISLGGFEEQVHYIHHDGIEHHYVYIDDNENEPISEHFEECAQFIDAIDGAVVVHCWAGISRSSTIVIAYLNGKNLFLPTQFTI